MDEKTVDFLILGQGFSGSALGLLVEELGYSYMIISNKDKHSASSKAVGLVNPVTGRRMAKTWNYDELMPLAVKFYGRVFETIFKARGNFLNLKPIYKALFSIEEMNFLTAKSAMPGYDEMMEIFLLESKKFPAVFKNTRAWAEIRNAARLEPAFFLQNALNYFISKESHLNVDFSMEQLQKVEVGWSFQGLKARNIVSCLGLNCPWTKEELWPNKGQVYEVEGLPNWGPEVLKTDVFLVPTQDGKVWIGSTYEREFENELPDQNGWQSISKDLDPDYLAKIEITKSWAGIRPTTWDRRPIIRKIEEGLFAINGMGTKGVSLAPFAAKNLLETYFGHS
jgi:glycine oxidase